MMRDLTALEVDCQDFGDLDAMRLVARPDGTDRYSGRCRSNLSVLHKPAVTVYVVGALFSYPE